MKIIEDPQTRQGANVQYFISPIERLIAEGKLVPVPEAEIRRLTEHMGLTYVPAMIRYRSEQARLATKVRNVQLS